MIDWCINCADAGCILAKKKSIKYRLFAYVFVRIMKDVLASHKEEDYFMKIRSSVWCLDKKFYEEFIKDSSVENMFSKIWHNKKYWQFMRHMIADSVSDIDLWNDYIFSVNIDKDNAVYFMFGKMK